MNNNNNVPTKTEASASTSISQQVNDTDVATGILSQQEAPGDVFDRVMDDWDCEDDVLRPDSKPNQVKLTRKLFIDDNSSLSEAEMESVGLLQPKVEPPETSSPNTVEVVANVTTPRNLIQNMSILKDELDQLVDTSIVQCKKAIQSGNIEEKCQDFFRREALRTNGGVSLNPLAQNPLFNAKNNVQEAPTISTMSKKTFKISARNTKIQLDVEVKLDPNCKRRVSVTTRSRVEPRQQNFLSTQVRRRFDMPRPRPHPNDPHLYRFMAKDNPTLLYPGLRPDEILNLDEVEMRKDHEKAFDDYHNLIRSGEIPDEFVPDNLKFMLPSRRLDKRILNIAVTVSKNAFNKIVELAVSSPALVKNKLLNLFNYFFGNLTDRNIRLEVRQEVNEGEPEADEPEADEAMEHEITIKTIDENDEPMEVINDIESLSNVRQDRLNSTISDDTHYTYSTCAESVSDLDSMRAIMGEEDELVFGCLSELDQQIYDQYVAFHVNFCKGCDKCNRGFGFENKPEPYIDSRNPSPACVRIIPESDFEDSESESETN